ncbi:MAG: cupin domain-containing protein [Chloroflexota bacterium]|nr:cupin domain-containing protein [Chloroflexota bacterium]
MIETPAKTREDAFHQLIHANHIYGLWELASQMTPHPQPQAVPHMWPASLIQSVVEASGQAVPVGEERRAMQLFNPGLEGHWATTNTLIAAIQVLLPGEVARAHRHTPTAIRFIMQGSGAYTKVDGERVYMEPGDLILTPSWSWHDHGNDTNQTVVWMDGLDVPLIQALDAMFFQFYSERQVPDQCEPNASHHLHGHAALRPAWVKEKKGHSPLMLYPWSSTQAALQAMRDQQGDPHDGVLLEYTDPRTGGPALPTMACCIQLLRPGQRLPAHRHTGSAIYYAVRGSGVTVMDGQAFHWTQGSVFAQPSWALHEHANASTSEDAILFSIQDTPVLRAMNLHYEETLAENGGHQQVTSTFGSNL